jgi:hypothetical protein
MTYQNTIDTTAPPIRTIGILIDFSRSLIGAIRRRRRERLRRIAARELDRKLRSYPDYLLKDIGYVRSSPPSHGEPLRYRF